MKLENQLTSLEHAKKLKELGVKQESVWYYRLNGEIGRGFNSDIVDGKMVWNISAFTVAELGEMLPEINFQTYREKKEWIITDHQINLPVQKANTEANTRAKMLIYLLENNLLLKK